MGHEQKERFEMTIYGYARVSMDGQTLDCQHTVLKAAGCQIIYSEKTSNTRSHRLELAKLLRVVGEGDTVIITRLDRVARSTRELLNTLNSIAKANATFKSLADSWVDTTAPRGRLLVTMLEGLAEFERELINVERRTSARQVRCHGAPTEADTASATRSFETSPGGRAIVRDRPHVWRSSHYDCAAKRIASTS
jgi:DNA invertase Pin-like site-specific DNA recombinase